MMEASILIVSKNRKAALRKTLHILFKGIDKRKHEIRVFLDGCRDGSEVLKEEFPSVFWESSAQSLGASQARNRLYKKAKGTYFFGFDDDAHPLQQNFIQRCIAIFKEHPNLAIIGFQEVKGIFKNDAEIKLPLDNDQQEFLVKDFVGCGFAIKKEIYLETRGFPKWIDIYGEEVCVAMEVLQMGYDILYTQKITVNHRVDLEKRKHAGANYFRFGKQLKNSGFFYAVYYPFPMVIKKIFRLYYMNFKKYALKDKRFFWEYWRAFGRMLYNLPMVLKNRHPVSVKTIKRFNSLANPNY